MIRVDHVAFGVRSRDDAVDAMHALGFATSPPCTCEWESRGAFHSADAACCVFADQYLDLIHVPDPEWLRHLERSALYRRGLAPSGIVLSGLSPATAARHVRGEPHAIVRRFDDAPSTSIRYEFLPLAGLGLPFGLVADASPGSLRRMCPRSHPNTARGIARLHLRVPSIDEALERLREEPLNLSASPEITLGDGAKILLHETPLDGHLGAVSSLLLESPRPALLAIEYDVVSIRATADILRAHGLDHQADGRRLLVDPSEGFGTGILFGERHRIGE